YAPSLGNRLEVALGDIQSELDKYSLEIVDNQKLTLQGRKKLAEQTKGKYFRKQPDDRKLAEVKTLLKAYQQEIDQMTHRMKATESAYLELYSQIGQVPDPVPLLDQLMSENERLGQIELLESENKLLRKELTEAVRSLSKAKSQESQTTKMKARLEQLESQMETQVKTKVSEKVAEIRKETEDVIQHLKDREVTLQKQVNTANRTLAQLQSSQDSVQAQVMDKYQSYDESTLARLAEMDIIQSELDRANGRIISLQSTNDQLKRDLARVLPQEGEETTDSTSDPLAATIELQQTVGYLNQEVDRLKRELAGREKAAASLPQMEGQLKSKDAEINRLQAQMQQYDDYPSLKRELEVMKAVEFSLSSWDAPDTRTSESTNEAQQLSVNDSLEKILLETNKRLQSEATHLKLMDRRQEYEQIDRELAQTKHQLAEKNTLVASLEDDLMKIQEPDSTDPFTSFSPMGSAGPNSPARGGTDQGGRSSMDLTVGNNATNKSPMIQIIAGQRDRLKQRVHELENDVVRAKSEMADLKIELSTLKEDNIKLYEKIRYMQTYQTDPSQFGLLGSSDSNSKGSTCGQRSGKSVMSTVTRKYREIYEAAKNPFEIFQQQESMRHYRSLNAADRATLNLGRLLLTNKVGRIFLIVYTLCLHLYVTFMVYRGMTAHETNCDQVKVTYPTSPDA
ncbi:CASP C terminal-domain-containing protein, partial [Dimargaris cristalligena]